MREIANSDLMLPDIPPPNADWSVIDEFALTYDGYQQWGSFQKCAEIGNASLHRSLDELRTCLFFEQRRWRHFGGQPNEDAMIYIRSIVEKIRAVVKT